MAGKRHQLVNTRKAAGFSQERQRQLEAATATLHEAVDVLDEIRGGGGLTVVFSAARDLYPWRQEQAVHDVQDRLLALLARA